MTYSLRAPDGAITELEAVRTCVRRGRPYGGEAWSRAAAERLGLQSALRSRGRPRKEEDMA